MEIVVKFLEQTPGCSSDDTMTVYKVQKIVRDVKFRHLELSKLRESLERVIQNRVMFRENGNKYLNLMLCFLKMPHTLCLCMQYRITPIFSYFVNNFLNIDIQYTYSCYEMCTLLYYFWRKDF